VSARTTAVAAASEPPTPRERPPRAGWTQVPRPFLDATPLDNDRLAHVLLMSYAWDEDNDCHPYQRELADELGCSVRTVKRRTADLRADELVTVRRGGQGKANVYHLTVGPVHAGDGEVGYATVPNAVLDDARLSQGAKRAYIMLCHHASAAGRCERTVGEIAHDVGAASRRSVYTYLRELARTGHLRIQAQERGLPNVYHVGAQKARMRAARRGTAPLMAVECTEEGTATAADARWRALYAELMGPEPPRPALARQVWALIGRVGEATVLDALRGAARFAEKKRLATLTIGMIRYEVDHILREGDEGTSGARPAVETVEIALPAPDMEPAWRDTLTALRGEMTPDNYKRWLEPTTVEALDGGLLRVGVPDAFSQQWLDKRLRGAIERALSRVAPRIRVVFEVRGEGGCGEITVSAIAAERPPPAALVAPPARASPATPATITVERCRHCHALPCRCPRKERRARERAAGGRGG
jgi:hypothetical protein